MPLFMGVVCRAERIGGFGNVEGYKGRDIDGGRTVIAAALSRLLGYCGLYDCRVTF